VAKDSTIVKINITAKDGSVEFEPVKTGAYMLQAEFNGLFISGNECGYIYVKHSMNLSAGLAPPIMKGKGTLKLNATDIFRIYTQVGSTSLLNDKDMFSKYTDSRYAALAFVYRFGNNKVAPARNSGGGAVDEKKRAGGN